VVVGHRQDEDVQKILACARHLCVGDWQGAKIARFGDNMRDVAVTEGDKVEAQIRLGYDVYGYGVGDLVQAVNEASDSDVQRMAEAYLDEYEVVPALQPGGERYDSLIEGARIEAGMRNFLKAGAFAFTTTSMICMAGTLPGLAAASHARCYGFGAEGELKVALVRQ
jgi:L-arabinose isomerase